MVWIHQYDEYPLHLVPCQLGSSVVGAIQKRNETWLAKKPVFRDPYIFNRAEAAMGPLSREVTCKIQKWNINAGFHPILVANARDDWLALKDDDITKKFPILLEGILQDVFSQRASSAWQGAQPQKLTVSMLLPGTSTASEWRDLLQSRRQFWPTLTTRHASLAPLCAEALQRERRQMQAKHLWYNLDIRWVDLENKLQVLAPTGLSREDIWKHLFLHKQRKNPFVEGRYTGADFEDVKRQWEAKKLYFLDYKKDGTRPPCIDLAMTRAIPFQCSWVHPSSEGAEVGIRFFKFVQIRNIGRVILAANVRVRARAVTVLFVITTLRIVITPGSHRHITWKTALLQQSSLFSPVVQQEPRPV